MAEIHRANEEEATTERQTVSPTASPLPEKTLKLTTLLHYGAAVLSVVAATLLRNMMFASRQDHTPYAFYYLAIVVSAWIGGLGPGLFATLASAIVTALPFLPFSSAQVMLPEDRLSFIIFLLVSLSIVAIGEMQQRARTNAALSAEEAQRHSAARVQSEQALQDTQTRLLRLMEANLIGILFGDIHGNIGEANDEFLRLVGYSRDDLRSGRLRWTDITPPEWLPFDQKGIAEARERGACTPYEKEYIRADGSRLPVLIGFILLGEAREDTVAIILDITESKRRQREIEALNASLRVAMLETDDRIKNNLQIISALLDIRTLQQEKTVPVEALQEIRSNVLTLALVHNALMQQVKENRKTNTLSTRSVLEKLAARMQETAGERPLRADIDDITLPTYQTTALALIANQLLLNAIKYGRGEIILRLCVEKDTLALEVCDDGPGFPADFDPKRETNTGLELIRTIARQSLSADIRFENRAEGGARISVLLSLPPELQKGA